MVGIGLNGFHKCVLRSLHYPPLGLTHNLIFCGKGPLFLERVTYVCGYLRCTALVNETGSNYHMIRLTTMEDN